LLPVLGHVWTVSRELDGFRVLGGGFVRLAQSGVDLCNAHVRPFPVWTKLNRFLELRDGLVIVSLPLQSNRKMVVRHSACGQRSDIFAQNSERLFLVAYPSQNVEQKLLNRELVWSEADGLLRLGQSPREF